MIKAMCSTFEYLTNAGMKFGVAHISLAWTSTQWSHKIRPKAPISVKCTSNYGWESDVDEFQLQAGEEIPEFTSIAIPALTILGTFLYFQRRHSRRNIWNNWHVPPLFWTYLYNDSKYNDMNKKLLFLAFIILLISLFSSAYSIECDSCADCSSKLDDNNVYLALSNDLSSPSTWITNQNQT